MTLQDSEILFITTSMFTKWQGYSDALIERFFPESMREHVDGRGGLFPHKWYEWIDISRQYEGIKYVIHIDEDCFLLGRRPLRELLEWMEDSEYDLAGISDGYTNCRRKNPVALNTFLMPIKHDTLVRMKDYEWIGKPTPRMLSSFQYPHPKCGVKPDPLKIEPYYPFFWTLFNENHKPYYLWPGFDHRTPGATIPSLDQYSESIALHMWWLRKCDNWECNVWGRPNPLRYETCEREILSPMIENEQ